MKTEEELKAWEANVRAAEADFWESEELCQRATSTITAFAPTPVVYKFSREPVFMSDSRRIVEEHLKATEPIFRALLSGPDAKEKCRAFLRRVQVPFHENE